MVMMVNYLTDDKQHLYNHLSICLCIAKKRGDGVNIYIVDRYVVISFKMFTIIIADCVIVSQWN